MPKFSPSELEAWTAVADRLGLAFDPGNWLEDFRLSGTIEGKDVVVRSVMDTSADGVDWTRYTVTTKPLGLGLRIRKKSPVGKLLRRGIKTGDPGFDRECKVQGDDPDRILLFLTPARTSAVRKYMKDLNAFKVDDDGVRCASGKIDKPERAEETVRALVAAARAIWD